jgi:aspartate aminotransferase
MLKQVLGRDTTVYITKPSWSNHRQVFESIGFAVQEFNYSASAGVDMQSLIQTLNEAAPKSIFVFHASAHNPSGWDCSPDQWKQIGAIVKERQLFPLFDAAYLGLTSGDYDRDAFAIRYFADELGLEIAVCLSFAKSMGLYGMKMILVLFFPHLMLTCAECSGERVGLCAFSSNTPTITAAVESSLARMIRAEISNPPAFGARIVAAVLEDEELYAQWRKDLVTMSSRIAEMRRQLYQGLTELRTLSVPAAAFRI